MKEDLSAKTLSFWAGDGVLTSARRIVFVLIVFSRPVEWGCRSEGKLQCHQRHIAELTFTENLRKIDRSLDFVLSRERLVCTALCSFMAARGFLSDKFQPIE
ncbi:hypothetical protein MPTK1_5g05050 [Marchantia polymorpha subsp. ruderalis]|uniref:Uncharacterized protein n=2 Tax=Marchantia polymorpha TaxID=3197 RepID=A0AAF6BF31_MARPO|nr:hypothetical protein MARPO_0027s0122 [Marchantia polymorpha]BBN10615.1 hypothetical protein Mp_5g05050 [Marchantia polymorpha subsp. ruderalis]|eukprot:PTQ43020.1 hypothetical protein MARPO_0027s0122 [Marchantia polymorpha]